MLISAALSALLSFSASQEPQKPLGLDCGAKTVLELRVCHSIREAIAATSGVKFVDTGIRTEIRVDTVEAASGVMVAVAWATVIFHDDFFAPASHDEEWPISSAPFFIYIERRKG